MLNDRDIDLESFIFGIWTNVPLKTFDRNIGFN